ncbi:MAG: hypothetical protein AAF657_29620 [Acidobacteriota bacterium]
MKLSTHDRPTAWIASVIWLLSLAPPGLISSTAQAAQLDPDERISLDLVAASLVETLQSFAQISGSRLDLDPTIEGSVTLSLTAPWREILDRLCVDHALNCEILEGEPKVLRARSVHGATGAAAQPGYAEAIAMSLKAADLRQTLQAFGLIAGREVLLDDAVSGTVTIEIESAPWPVILEEICNLSGCRVEWGRTTLQIRPTEASVLRRASWSFAATPLAEAFEILADLPIFGPLGEPEVEVSGAFPRPLNLELEDVSWLDGLNQICRAASCRWRLTYGAPSHLAVEPIDPGLEQRISLPPEATSLSQAADLLAGALSLELKVEPELDLTAQVRFTRSAATWREAIGEMCDQVGCYWSVRKRQLRLRPKVKTLAERPASSAESRRMAVRFTPPHPADPVAGIARFNWTAPIHTFVSETDERWWTRLSWIPFGHETHWVLPTIGRCDTKGPAAVRLLEPVRVPFDQFQRRAGQGSMLELRRPTADDAESESRWTQPCRTPSRDLIQVTFQATDSQSAVTSSLELAAEVGTYLLITPPSNEQRPPMAALVALAANEGGGQHLALVTPTPDGSELDVIQRTLLADEERSEILQAPDGRSFELRLKLIR